MENQEPTYKYSASTRTKIRQLHADVNEIEVQISIPDDPAMYALSEDVATHFRAISKALREHYWAREED